MELEECDKVALQINLIKLKSFSIIALKHLESVKGQNVHNDAEFIEMLWFCLNGIEIEAEDVRSIKSTLLLPGVDEPK